MDDRINGWIEALVARHTAALTRREFLKAVRALSARYVERRADLPRRRAVDSAGKRAAFAAFYAPMHFLATREIVRGTGLDRAALDRIVDLGCGTGVAGAAWALAAHAPPPAVVGLDRDRWALGEARWNWQMLGVRGTGLLSNDLGSRFRQNGNSGFHFMATGQPEFPFCRKRLPRSLDNRPVPLVVAWSVNELLPAARARLLDSLIARGTQGGPVLVIEPLARGAAPWWDDWAARAVQAGGRADEWRFDDILPPALAELSEAAGFRREALTARSVAFSGAARRARS